ncbi:MAG: PAS domain-containing protein [Clostridiales bacterium]|nr:PAS domain-containing protein [Clostridiales bacterium]
MPKNVHPIIQKFIPLVSVIAQTFGENCEVVLHDFSDLKFSIAAIENGHVTGRDNTSSMTEISYNKVVEGNIDKDIINYTGKSKDGRVLKSSTSFIRDDNNEVIGCFCINFDITELVGARKIFNDIIKIESDLVLSKDEIDDENKVNTVLSQLVNHAIQEFGKPIVYMSKEEKVAIVKKLDSQGTFLIKGAIDYVANVLCVSRYTIYNYLDEIR